MIITVIHGAMHKGITYSMTKAVLDKLGNDNEIHEFFMPADAPDYCAGCYNCFLKGEEYCPGAKKVQPIVKAIEQRCAQKSHGSSGVQMGNSQT